MPSKLNPYLNFRSGSREAMEFYKSVFGGDLSMMTFAQGGMPAAPADADKIMHSQLDVPNGFTLMASDTPPGMEPSPNGSISLSGDNESELRGYWDKLSAGGSVTMQLEKAPWGDYFGMCTDKFGVPWMVNIATGQQR